MLPRPAHPLTALLDPLTARVRLAELETLPAAVQLERPLEGLGALLDHLREARLAEVRIETQLGALRQEALALDADALRVWIAQRLTESEAPASARRAAATGRLDLACLMEREGARLEKAAVVVELCAKLLPGLADRAMRFDEHGALRALALGKAVARLTELAERNPRRPTRLAALTALQRLIAMGGATDMAGMQALALQLLADPEQDVWVRRAALRLSTPLPASAAMPLIAQALSAQHGPDDALLRAEATRLALARPETNAGALTRRLLADSSELVRFALAEGLARRIDATQPEAIEPARTLLAEGEVRTRARLCWELAQGGDDGAQLLLGCLEQEELVARTALDGLIRRLRAGAKVPQGLAEAVRALPPDLPVGLARRAGLLLAELELRANPARGVAEELSQLARGEEREIRLPIDASPRQLAEALVPFAHDGLGFQLDPRGGLDEPGARVRVHRGDRPTTRLWRVLDELRNPAPAKRQAHIHSIGRADRGPLRVPPARLAEATPTGVPDQRVILERQESWAPEVPLVDDLQGALRHGEVWIHSPLGRTRVRAPRGLAGASARLRSTWHFRRLSGLRNAALDTEDAAIARQWTDALDRLGFQVEHRPRRAGQTIDPLAFALSLGGSSLHHLVLVLALLLALLLGRLAWARQRIRRAREAIPLVIGGWGTRGKSGTERLKAGLLEALHIPFLSKTTGCEAMVLHAPPGGRARELFLYRPYDKATIWEQGEVTALAPAFGARVLLWECMALNPRYVEILQSWWVRDDISTLTNAFPDHEDIQGPTGLDVAEVIAGFSPLGGTVLTTEEEMLGLLREVAAERGCRVEAIPRPVHELLPRDLLARFRHREHPANVALVARLALALGVPVEEAIGFMAERVVADVGALVIHEPVRTAGRTIVFAQGQSANDPLSFRHSWRTAGFEEACPVGEWRVSVVNNRADRVARSRMFAGLLADQAAAHRHVFIGTNLQGLRSYLDEAVTQRLGRTDLRSRPAVERLFAHLRLAEPVALGLVLSERLGLPAAGRERWAREAGSLRPGGIGDLAQARTQARRLQPAAEALAEGLEATLGRELVEHLVEACARHLALLAALQGTAELRARLYRELVDASILIVADPKTRGDEIIDRVARSAPPGAFIRLIGLQNIKGTGLDFAYRWVEWGEVSAILRRLPRAAGEEKARLLSELATREYGSVMACEGVLDALGSLAESPERGLAAERIRARMQALLARRGKGGQEGGAREYLRALLERILDPLHGVLRRARGARILAELARMEVSHDRAQRELRELVDQQKGGWLRWGSGRGGA